MQALKPVPFLSPAQIRAGVTISANVSSANVSSSTPGLQVTGVGSTSPEPEAPNRPRKRKRILLISACLGITTVIAIAVALGVHFGARRNNDNASATNSTSNPDNNNKPPLQDPSNFTKDPKLKNSFYGVAYTLRDSLEPNCNQTLADTIIDMQLLSQITTRIRLYSSECNQTAMVLEAIKQTKTNVKVFPAIHVVDKDEVGYQRQKTALQQTLQTYGRDNVLGIIVGNEFMLNYIVEQNAANANGTVGLAASAILKAKIADIRQMLTSMGINILVGTADAGSYFNNDLLGAVDFGMANVHAWFAGTTVQDAANWTFTFFKVTNVDVADGLANKPQMYIAETGWPTYSSTVSEKTNKASDASEPNLQIFINNFVCSANTQGVKYFFFEFTDIPWKERLFPGVEGFWGLFNSNKTLKALTLPDCSHD